MTPVGPAPAPGWSPWASGRLLAAAAGGSELCPQVRSGCPAFVRAARPPGGTGAIQHVNTAANNHVPDIKPRHANPVKAVQGAEACAGCAHGEESRGARGSAGTALRRRLQVSASRFLSPPLPFMSPYYLRQPSSATLGRPRGGGGTGASRYPASPSPRLPPAIPAGHRHAGGAAHTALSEPAGEGRAAKAGPRAGREGRRVAATAVPVRGPAAGPGGQAQAAAAGDARPGGSPGGWGPA